MAPKLKLVYFDARGRMETTRLALAWGGLEFEDQRVAFGEEWAALKPSMPFQHVPVLVVDGATKLSESGAIARYAASLTGLLPSDALQRAQVEMVADSLDDIITGANKFKFGQMGEDEKATIKKKFFEETVPAYAQNLEKLLEANKTGLFVGDKITLADIAVYNTLSELVAQEPTVLDKSPKVKALVEKVGSEPKVKDWVSKRPVTPF